VSSRGAFGRLQGKRLPGGLAYSQYARYNNGDSRKTAMPKAGSAGSLTNVCTIEYVTMAATTTADIRRLRVVLVIPVSTPSSARRTPLLDRFSLNCMLIAFLVRE
jgi:hypothetical protein